MLLSYPTLLGNIFDSSNYKHPNPQKIIETYKISLNDDNMLILPRDLRVNPLKYYCPK